MPDFSFDRLRRYPDVEAENLFAVDASDRLILDEAAAALAAAGPGEVVVLEDHYGALTLGAAALHGARGIRTHQDGLSGEEALARNAAEAGLAQACRSLPLGEELLAGARVVLLQLPRSLSALDELADAVRRFAAPDVRVFAGGRIKHMTIAMNEVLARHFGELRVSPARQKSRVLVASQPLPPTDAPAWPRVARHDELALTVCAHGAAFAGTTIDIGTRYLLEFLDRMKPDAEEAIDLGCGTGVLAASLARRRPGLRLIATDQSAAAVASARATMEANGLADRVSVLRDDALGSRPDASAELILLNPPFHIGSSVHAGIALKLFEDAARVLRPGGELWTVWNTHLGYRPALTRIVGPTHQVGRNAKFTVTVSTRR
ncbi:class I SAM-dependent methyltransferase [Cryobacterium tagatosivorans]|uniref:Methyltransferase domain-containing protein n=1 Tax=Cryobacterium tagatosivorans TaxID=1259199 RepID=A0A4R8UJK3_9MICO|nr:methyltransferase [Cryobacterium tagatosivorans]TFB55932.1 methyltransferase domain-containing protein [Cryobacterium tagatosivorans]